MVDFNAAAKSLPAFAKHRLLIRLSEDPGQTLHEIKISNQGKSLVEISGIRRYFHESKIVPCKYGTNHWISGPVTIAADTTSSFNVHLGTKLYKSSEAYGYLVDLSDGTSFFCNYNLPLKKRLLVNARAILTELSRGRIAIKDAV